MSGDLGMDGAGWVYCGWMHRDHSIRDQSSFFQVLVVQWLLAGDHETSILSFRNGCRKQQHHVR